jgi:hypothetical protein
MAEENFSRGQHLAISELAFMEKQLSLDEAKPSNYQPGEWIQVMVD